MCWINYLGLIAGGIVLDNTKGVNLYVLFSVLINKIILLCIYFFIKVKFSYS